jgi:hypothetical protein
VADPLALIVIGPLLLVAGLLFATLGTRAWPLLQLLLAGVLGGLIGGSAVSYFTSSVWVVAVAAVLVGVGLAIAADHLSESGMAMSLSLLVFVLALASWDELRAGSAMLYPVMILGVAVFVMGVVAARFSPALLFAGLASLSTLLGLVLVGAYVNEDWSSAGMLAAVFVFLGGIAIQWFDLEAMRRSEKALSQKRPASVISAPPRT